MEFLELFRGFFPSGPLTTIYACFLLIVTSIYMKWGRKDISDIAAILFVSWWVALLATALHSAHVQGIGTIAVMALLYAVGTKTAFYIIGLCSFKLLVYSANITNMLKWEQMWAASEVFAYLSLFVLIGGSVNGRFLGRGLGAGFYRRSPVRRVDLPS